MKKFTFYCLLAALCGYVSATARDKPRQYFIGDQLPALKIHTVNGDAPIELGPRAGTAVLIDFFATSCGPCVGSLPKLDSLARLFGEQLQVLVVSREKPGKLQAFLAKRPALTQGRLRWVAADTLLCHYFPHVMVPHEVWLDAAGRVKAISSHSEVNEASLQLLVKGQSLQVPVKADILDYHRSRNLFSYSPEWTTDAIRFGSYFTQPLPGALSGSGFYEGQGFQKLYNVNAPLLRHYEMAFGIRPGYMLREQNARGAIAFPKDSLYCYEQIVPPTQSREGMLQRMRVDLEQFTGFSAHARKAPPGSSYLIPDTLWVQPLPTFFTN